MAKRGRPKKVFSWVAKVEQALRDQEVVRELTRECEAEEARGANSRTAIGKATITVAQRRGVSDRTIRSARERYEEDGKDLLRLIAENTLLRRAIEQELFEQRGLVPASEKHSTLIARIASMKRAEDGFWSAFEGQPVAGGIAERWPPSSGDPLLDFWQTGTGDWVLTRVEEGAAAQQENGKLRADIEALRAEIEKLRKQNRVRADFLAHSRNRNSR